MLRSAFGISAILFLSSLSAPGAAQSPASAAGRWEGHIDVQHTKVGMVLVLSQKPDGTWSGTISIRAQALADSPLANVSAKDSTISFAMPGIPGDPVFQGKLSTDGKTISGEFIQGGAKVPFSLERRTAAESAALTYGPTPDKGQPGQGIEGSWQGIIDTGGGLRVVLKVKNTAGVYSALLDSPDQGVSDMLVDSIDFKEKSLKFEMTRLSVVYEGTLGPDGSEISGQWRQGGASFALSLKRLAKK